MGEEKVASPGERVGRLAGPACPCPSHAALGQGHRWWTRFRVAAHESHCEGREERDPERTSMNPPSTEEPQPDVLHLRSLLPGDNLVPVRRKFDTHSPATVVAATSARRREHEL